MTGFFVQIRPQFLAKFAINGNTNEFCGIFFIKNFSLVNNILKDNQKNNTIKCQSKNYVHLSTKKKHNTDIGRAKKHLTNLLAVFYIKK